MAQVIVVIKCYVRHLGLEERGEMNIFRNCFQQLLSKYFLIARLVCTVLACSSVKSGSIDVDKNIN